MTTFGIFVLIDIIYITPIFDHLVSLLIPYQNMHPVDFVMSASVQIVNDVLKK